MGSGRRTGDRQDFYSRPHRLIFQAMTRLSNAGNPIDLITLQEELERPNSWKRPVASPIWWRSPRTPRVPPTSVPTPRSCVSGRSRR
ncbi:hypothetical protein H2136_05150 [Aeromonas hydrophila]|uniref:DNA helicase DnaB-like N-terminal domain-containing protein n=1 Tax=Aeromonas hydrophila TaxID=644 RepID=A0A926ITF3_AERHY|nr:hypothetical protein [Aeromonas hydrophila]